MRRLQCAVVEPRDQEADAFGSFNRGVEHDQYHFASPRHHVSSGRMFEMQAGSTAELVRLADEAGVTVPKP